jgi:uncharacterized protein (DUF58 family)
MRALGDVFLSTRFFRAIGGLAVLAAASYVVPAIWPLVPLAVIGLGAATVVDAVLLWRHGGVSVAREVPDRLSNGGDNDVLVRVTSAYPFSSLVEVVDEAPIEFQLRDLAFRSTLPSGASVRHRYVIRPTRRGAYTFGSVIAYAHGPLGLAVRRFRGETGTEVKVYPAFLEMQRYAFLATNNRLEEVGIKRIRRMGHTMEFDQIRNYVAGDDPRTVNWKATARRGHLMSNQFEEERSQPVYVLLDMGRTMRPAFQGMTLLDHAINAALVLLNTALVKGDRAGLIAFGREVDVMVPAERRAAQRHRLLEALYNQTTQFTEPDYEALAATVRRQVNSRALLVLFANFETVEGLQRQLPMLRLIARSHLVVAVFFENVGLDEVRSGPADDVMGVYVKGVAEKLSAEKHAIVGELRNHGVQALLTRPEHLTVDVLNRYLRIKALGVL